MQRQRLGHSAVGVRWGILALLGLVGRQPCHLPEFPFRLPDGGQPAFRADQFVVADADIEEDGVVGRRRLEAPSYHHLLGDFRSEKRIGQGADELHPGDGDRSSADRTGSSANVEALPIVHLPDRSGRGLQYPVVVVVVEAGVQVGQQQGSSLGPFGLRQPHGCLRTNGYRGVLRPSHPKGLWKVDGGDCRRLRDHRSC